MIGYVTLGVADLERARGFYDALFATIDARRLLQLDDQHGFTMYGTAMNRPGVVILTPYNEEPAQAGNGNMVALVMDAKEKVDAFHAKALELGASDEGAPGYRNDPKFGYYFAYFRDLDGNKLAVFTIAPQG